MIHVEQGGIFIVVVIGLVTLLHVDNITLHVGDHNVCEILYFG